MSTREEYIRRMREKLEEWNTDIDNLSAKASEVSADVRSEYNEQIAALRVKQAAARQKIDEMQKSGESAWKDLKVGIELAWSAIGEAVDSAKKRFK
ncbi:MAG: sll1863 family stress response protein [Desulfuromonadaceae bacterium]